MSSVQSINTPQDYVNYTFNLSSRGITEVTSELAGMSSTVSNLLGLMAFKTSEYLTHSEALVTSFGFAAVAAFGSATQEAMKFEQAIANVQAIGGESINAMEIGQAAMQYSTQFGMDVNSMTEGLEALSRAGLTATNVMSGVLAEGVKLSKLEGMDLEDSINDLISTTNLLAESTYDVNSQEYANAVKQINQHIVSTSESAPINAQNIIQSLQHVGGYVSANKIDQDDLFAVIAQLGSKGTKGEMAGTALRAFIASGQKDQAQRALSRVGLDVSDLWDSSGEAMLPISEMKDVIDAALEGRGYSQQEKLEFYSDFVGYKQANQIMKINTSEVQQYKESIAQAWDLGKKLETILGTANNNVQILFQTVKNFMTKVGSNLLPVISMIVKPITLAIQLIDKIPFSDKITGIALGLMAARGVLLIINRVVPAIGSLYTSINKSDKRFQSLHHYAMNFKEEINEAYDTLQHIGDREWLAQKRLDEDIFGASQNAMIHKEVSRDLYQATKTTNQPDWYDLPSFIQESWYEYADTLRNEDIYEQVKQEKIGDMKILFQAQGSSIRQKTKQELNQDSAQAKAGFSELTQEFADTNDNINDTNAILNDVKQYQAHLTNIIKQNIDKGSNLQYDIGKGIMSVADVFADKIAEAIDKKLNSIDYEIGGGLSYTGYGDVGESAADELKNIFDSFNIDELPDMSFAYQSVAEMEQEMKQLRRTIKKRAEDFSNIDVLKMSGRQAMRSGKDLSLDYLTQMSKTYSANRNEADIRHLLTTGKWRDPKDETKGIRLKQLDKIEKILGIKTKRPENDRAGRLDDIYKVYQALKGETKERTFNQIVAESRNEWLSFLDARTGPGAEPTSHIDPSFAKTILDNLAVPYDSTGDLVKQLQTTFNDFKEAQNYGMINLINQMLFADQKDRAAGVYTESETSELKYMIEHYLMLQKALNKDEKISHNTEHHKDELYHTGEYGPQVDGSGNIINSFLENTDTLQNDIVSLLQNDIVSLLQDTYDEIINITSALEKNTNSIKEQLSESIAVLQTSSDLITNTIDLAVSTIGLNIKTTGQRIEKTIFEVDDTLTRILDIVSKGTDTDNDETLFDRMKHYGTFDIDNMFNDDFNRVQEFIKTSAVNLLDMSDEGANGLLGVAFGGGTLGLDIKALWEAAGTAGIDSVLETYIHEMGHVILGHAHREYGLESDDPLHIPDIDVSAWGYEGASVIAEMETRLLTASVMNKMGLQQTAGGMDALKDFTTTLVGTDYEKYVNYELIENTVESILENIENVFNPLMNAKGYVVGNEAGQFFTDTIDWLKANIAQTSSLSKNAINTVSNAQVYKTPMASDRISGNTYEDGGSFDDYEHDQGVTDNGMGYALDYIQYERDPVNDEIINSEPSLDDIERKSTPQQIAMTLKDAIVFDAKVEADKIIPVYVHSINGDILSVQVQSFGDLLNDIFSEEDNGDDGAYTMIDMLGDIATSTSFMKNHWEKDKTDDKLAEETLQDFSAFMVSRQDIEAGYDMAKEQLEQAKYDNLSHTFGMFTGPLIGDASIYDEAEQQYLGALLGRFMGATITNQLAGTAILREIDKKEAESREALKRATEKMEKIAKNMEDVKHAMYSSDVSTKTPLLEAGESILQIAEVSTAQGEELNKAFEKLIFNMDTASKYFAQEDWQNQPTYNRDPSLPQWRVTIDTYPHGIDDNAEIMRTPALILEDILNEILASQRLQLGRDLYDSEIKYWRNHVQKEFQNINPGTGVVYYTGTSNIDTLLSPEQLEAKRLKQKQEDKKKNWISGNINTLQEEQPNVYGKFFNDLPHTTTYIDKFVAKKRKSTTEADREFLSQTYGIDISKARTSKQAHKIIIKTLEDMGSLFSALEELYNHADKKPPIEAFRDNVKESITDLYREDLLDINARMHMATITSPIDLSNIDAKSIDDLSDTEYSQLYNALVMLYGADRVHYGEGGRKSLQQLIDLHAYEMMKHNAQVELNERDNFDEKRERALEKDRLVRKSNLLGRGFGHTAKGLSSQGYIDIIDSQFYNPELDELSQSYALLETSNDLFDITRQMLGGVELFNPPSKTRSEETNKREEFLAAAKLMYPEIFKQVMDMSLSEQKQFRRDFETGNLQTSKDIQLAQLQKQYPGQFKMVSSFSEERQRELAANESNMPMYQIARALTSAESNLEELSIMNDIIKAWISDDSSYESTSSVNVDTSDKHNDAFDTIKESNETLKQQQEELQQQIEYENNILNQIIDDVNYSEFTDAIDEIKKGIQLKADILSIIARGKRQHEDFILAEETEKENEKLTQALKDAEEYYDNSQKAYTPIMGAHLVTPDVINIANQQLEKQKNIQAQQKRKALLGQIERGEYIPIHELEAANLHGWIEIQEQRNAEMYKNNIMNELPLVGITANIKDPTHRSDTKLTTKSQVTDSKWIAFLNDWIEEEYQEGGIEQLEHRFAQIKKSALEGGHSQRTHIDRIFAKLLENRIDSERALLNQSLLQEKDEQFRQETKVKPAQDRKKEKTAWNDAAYEYDRKNIERLREIRPELEKAWKIDKLRGVNNLLKTSNWDDETKLVAYRWINRRIKEVKENNEKTRNENIMKKVREKINEKNTLKEEGEKLWEDIERAEQMSQDLIRIRTEEDLKNNKMLFNALNSGRKVDDWAIRVMSNLKTDTGKKDFINNILELAKQNKQISAPLLDYFTTNAGAQDVQKFIQQSLDAMRSGQQIPQQYLDFILSSEYSSDYQKQQARAYEKINQDRIKEQQRRNARRQKNALKTPYGQRLRQAAWKIRLAELEAQLGGPLPKKEQRAYKRMFYEDYNAEDAWKVKKQELIDRGEWDKISARKQQEIHDNFVNNFGIETVSLERMQELQKEAQRAWLREGFNPLQQSGQWQKMNQEQRKQAKSNFIEEYLSVYQLTYEDRQKLEQERLEQINAELEHKKTEEYKQLLKAKEEELERIRQERERIENNIKNQQDTGWNAKEQAEERLKREKKNLEEAQNDLLNMGAAVQAEVKRKTDKELAEQAAKNQQQYGYIMGVGIKDDALKEEKAKQEAEQQLKKDQAAARRKVLDAIHKADKHKYENIDRERALNKKRAENFKKMDERETPLEVVSMGSGMFDYHNYMNDMNNLIPDDVVLTDDKGNPIKRKGQLTQEEFDAKYKDKYKEHAEAEKIRKEEKERIEQERLERLRQAQRARKIRETIQPVTDLIKNQGQRISTFLNDSVFKDAEDNIGVFSETADQINNTIKPLREFNGALEKVSETFPALTPLVVGVNTVLGATEKITQGLKYAEIALIAARIIGKKETEDMATMEGYEAAKKWAESINKYIDPDSWLGQTIGQVGQWGTQAANMAKETIGNAFKYLLSLGPEVLIPLGIAAAAIVAVIAGLWIWEKKYAEALKKSQEELEESTKKQHAALQTYKSIKQARENETDAMKKQQIARKEAIALYELEAARARRRKAVNDEAKLRNDSMWGEYGLRASLQKMGLGIIAGGDFKSQYEKYDGTTANIRQIKESTLGNLFASREQSYVASVYDRNSTFFAEVEAYKEPLQELYDKESKLIEQYGSIDLARGSKEFQEAVQEFADATGINGETAAKMLDWLDTENRVNQATKVGQAQIGVIRARADAKVAALEYGEGGDLNDMNNLGNAMVLAQFQEMMNTAKTEVWWELLFAYLDTFISIMLPWKWGDVGKNLAKVGIRQEELAELDAEGNNILNSMYEQYENADRRDYGNGISYTADTPFGGAISSAATMYAEDEQQKLFNSTGQTMSEGSYSAIQDQYAEDTFGITEEGLKQQKAKEDEEAYRKAQESKENKADTTLGQLQNNGEQAHEDAMAIVDAIKNPGVVSGIGAGISKLIDDVLIKEGLSDLFAFLRGEDGTVTSKILPKMKDISIDSIRNKIDTFWNGKTYGPEGLRSKIAAKASPYNRRAALWMDELWNGKMGEGAFATFENGKPVMHGERITEGLKGTSIKGLASKGVNYIKNIPSRFSAEVAGARDINGWVKDGGLDMERTLFQKGVGVYDDVKGALTSGNIRGIGPNMMSRAQNALARGKGAISSGIDKVKGTKTFGRISDRIELAREANTLAADGVAVSRNGIDKAVGAFDGAKAAYADDGLKGLANFGKAAGKDGIKGLAQVGKTASSELGGARGVISSVSGEVGGIRGLASGTTGAMKSAFSPSALKGGFKDIGKGLKGGGTLAKGIGRVGGAALMALGPALAFADKASELNPFEGKHYNEDGTEKKALQATGEVVGTTAGAVGGVAGGLAGAEAGAALGATIGSVIPGVGTVIGGALGAVAGGIAGGWLGDTIFQPIGDAIGGTIGWLGDNLLGGIQNVAGTVWDGLTGAAGGVWDAVTGAAGGVWDFLTGGDKGNQPVGGLLGLTPIGMGINAAAGISDWLSGKDGENDPYQDLKSQGKEAGEKARHKSENTIIIKNININTEDDPEKIKSALMNLIIEMQEQIAPRTVSRTVGEPPAQSTSTSQNENNESQAEGTDEQSGTQNNTNNNTNTTM